MRRTRDEGFEVGVHAWDHVKWQDGLDGACAEWTGKQMKLACDRFTDIFKEAPRTHGAAGLQMNVHATPPAQVLRFENCSHTPEMYPHLPVWDAQLIRFPQLPQTPPTLDVPISTEGLTQSNG